MNLSTSGSIQFQFTNDEAGHKNIHCSTAYAAENGISNIAPTPITSKSRVL